MQQPPRHPNEPVITPKLFRRILVVSVFNWILMFGLFEWAKSTTVITLTSKLFWMRQEFCFNDCFLKET